MATTPQGSGRPGPGVPVRTASPSRRPLGVCQGLDVLVRLDHYVVTLDTQCSLCCAQRTSAAFERTSDIEACFGRIEQALASVPRARYMLLVDARTGPGRNDSSFEAVVAQQRGKLLFGFARNAALAATAAGRLQIQRYAKADGRTVFATGSPEEAFAYLGLSFHPI